MQIFPLPASETRIAVAGQAGAFAPAAAPMERLLKTTANPELKGGSSATTRIISAGEIFADGTMIELISGSSGLDKPAFLLWDGKKASVGTHIKHGGWTYQVPELIQIVSGQRSSLLDVATTIQPATCLPQSPICLCNVIYNGDQGFSPAFHQHLVG